MIYAVFITKNGILKKTYHSLDMAQKGAESITDLLGAKYIVKAGERKKRARTYEEKGC